MKIVEATRWRMGAEFFRNSNNISVRREKKIHIIQLRAIHVGLLLVVAVSLAALSSKTAHFLLTWEKLRVHTFQLLHEPEYERLRVRQILQRYRQNIIAVSLADLQRELLQLREVQDVSITRVLPGKLEIVFRLKEPVFQVWQRGQYTLLDGSGQAIAEVAASRAGLLMINTECSDQIKKIVSARTDLDKVRPLIELVGYREPYGIELKLKGLEELLYPGEGDYAEKIRLYQRIKAKCRGWQQPLQYADLRFTDRMYVAGFSDGGGSDEK